MSEQHTFRPASWQARGHRIAELERQLAGTQAAIRGRSAIIDECMRTVDDLERQRAAIQAANEQLRAALVVAQQAIADIRNLNAYPRSERTILGGCHGISVNYDAVEIGREAGYLAVRDVLCASLDQPRPSRP